MYIDSNDIGYKIYGLDSIYNGVEYITSIDPTEFVTLFKKIYTDWQSLPDGDYRVVMSAVMSNSITYCISNINGITYINKSGNNFLPSGTCYIHSSSGTVNTLHKIIISVFGRV